MIEYIVHLLRPRFGRIPLRFAHLASKSLKELVGVLHTFDVSDGLGALHESVTYMHDTENICDPFSAPSI